MNKGDKEEPMNADDHRTWDPVLPRMAAIFGLAASALLILAVVFVSQITVSSDDLAGSVQDMAHHRFAAGASAWLFALALIGLVPFFLGLAATLGQRGSRLGWIGAALLIAFAVMNAPANLAPFVVAHHLAAGINAGDPVAQAVAEGMVGLFLVVDMMAHVVFGIGALLTARAMAADGRFPRWLPPVAAIAGILMILFALSLAVPALDLALALGSAFTLLWIIGSSLWLLGLMRAVAPAGR
jgi:hypothetical protein